MSKQCILAARRMAAYRTDVPAKGDGKAGNFRTLTILRELSVIAHDAGVVQVGVRHLADRVGASERSVRFCLQRLAEDGWIVEAVRGTGNRYRPGDPRASVYVLRPMPDTNGELNPAGEWLSGQWAKYTVTARWMGLSRHHQAAIAAAVWARYESPEAVELPPARPATTRLRRVQ